MLVPTRRTATLITRITALIAVVLSIATFASPANADYPYDRWSNEKSGLCLGVLNANMANGTKAIQWGCNGLGDQYWSVGDSWGTMKVGLNHNKCLGVLGGAVASGSTLVIWDCNNNPDQKWRWEAVGPNCVGLRNYGSGRFLSVRNQSTAQGAEVTITDYQYPALWQRWCSF